MSHFYHAHLHFLLQRKGGDLARPAKQTSKQRSLGLCLSNCVHFVTTKKDVEHCLVRSVTRNYFWPS